MDPWASCFSATLDTSSKNWSHSSLQWRYTCSSRTHSHGKSWTSVFALGCVLCPVKVCRFAFLTLPSCLFLICFAWPEPSEAILLSMVQIQHSSNSYKRRLCSVVYQGKNNVTGVREESRRCSYSPFAALSNRLLFSIIFLQYAFGLFFCRLFQQGSFQTHSVFLSVKCSFALVKHMCACAPTLPLSCSAQLFVFFRKQAILFWTQ